MNPYLEKLKAYVETHPIRFDDDCDFPALDSLYWHYSECHNMSNEKTKQASADLSACLDDLNLKDNDRVFWVRSVQSMNGLHSWQDSGWGRSLYQNCRRRQNIRNEIFAKETLNKISRP